MNRRMGFGKKEHSEEKLENHNKTENELTELKDEVCGDPGGTPAPSEAGNLASLTALLNDTESSQGEWPKEMLRNVLRRFGRMPRTGWSKAHESFCGKFNSSVSFEEFKRKALTALVSTTGRKCTTREFKKEAVKRVKTLDAILEEKTLHEAKVYNETRLIYLDCKERVKETGVDKAERTRKVPCERINHLVLEAVTRLVDEHLKAKPPSDMTEIAKVIQTAQLCYSKATIKRTQPSTWRSSIERKIENWKVMIDLLERVKKPDKLDKEEKSKVQVLMSQEKLKMGNARDATEAITRLNERIIVFSKKIEMHEKRKTFSRQNNTFELYRRRFYMSLGGEGPVQHEVPKGEIRDFWSTMWNKRPESTEAAAIEQYLPQYLPGNEPENMFPSYEEFQQIIKFLPNWKAAGPDGIFNFFIKKLEPVHRPLYEVIRKICLEKQYEAEWFYKGITYLIPKGIPKKGSDFRPITCMSNLYKLTTKCVTRVMQSLVEARDLLAENQMGTVRMVQGAKEQALLNIAINTEYGNELKTAWIDVKKAFDSVDHNYLIKCIEAINFPPWVSRFLKDTITRWKIAIMADGQEIMEKKVERGILQGDSLSPLLFVLCIDPLSRVLNAKYQKVGIKTETGMHITNHLLFIDDLKLLAKEEGVLKEMLEETKRFFNTIGLEMNKDKSATNSDICAGDATLLEGKDGYKYLGIIEDKTSSVTSESLEKIKKEIFHRVEKLCATKLNAVNLFKAINEHAISVINYQIGVLKLEPRVFEEIDDGIRSILIDHNIHMQPSCKERLYLSRNLLGRGLVSIEQRSEQMLLELNRTLDASKRFSTRRAAILKVEKDQKSHLALISRYLAEKYQMEENFTKAQLCEAQQKALLTKIKDKECHERLYRACDHEMIDVKESSKWLKSGNIKPRDEAAYCFLQDRNIFMGEKKQCPHCRAATRTVDHLATKCDRMLGHDYTRRHNEVVKCIHLAMCNKFGLKSSRKLWSHSVQEVIANDNAEIRVDTRIKTDVKIQNNRPDIFVYDKKRKEITLIEIGITNLDLLTQVENEKLRKYDLLANEIALSYKCKVKIVPYVMTWEGLVTNYHKRYIKEIEISPKSESYIQTVVLKKTLESISFERRRGIEEEDSRGEAQEAVQRLCLGTKKAPSIIQ